MKDYTKYDFAAIVGAEVKIYFKDGGDYKGTLVSDAPELTAICVRHHLGFVRKICKESILYLTAKIKVEDMSVKQLKHFAKQEVGDDEDARIGMGVNVNVFYIQANWDESQGYLFDKEYGLTDCIDCTDWGWKHE